MGAARGADAQRSPNTSGEVVDSEDANRQELRCRLMDRHPSRACGDESRIYYVGFQPHLWYNRVDGLHLGLDRTVQSSRYFKLGGGAGWNSALSGRERWTWNVRVRLQSVGKTSGFMQGQYQAQTARRYDTRGFVSAFTNGVGMLFGGTDYFDYYRSDGFRMSTGVVFRPVGVRFSGTFLHEDHAALLMTTSYDLFKAAALRMNPTIEPGHMQTISARFEMENVQPEAFRRSFLLEAELSTAGSDYTFKRYEAEIRWQQPTYCRRCMEPGVLDLFLVAGTSTGNLPLQRTFVVDRRSTLFSDIGMLRSLSAKDHSFEGDRMIAFFWEHNFQRIGLKSLGFRGLARAGLRLHLFGGHAQTWLLDSDGDVENESQFIQRDTQGLYHELGFALSGSFGGEFSLRIDFVWSLDEGPLRVGLGFGRKG